MKNFQCEKFYKILDYYKLLFASQHKLLIFSLHLGLLSKDYIKLHLEIIVARKYWL